MESDNENSLASSISSLSRRVTGAETGSTDRISRHNHHYQQSVDLDELSTEPSEYEIDGSVEGRETHFLIEGSSINGPLSKIPPEVMLVIFSQINEKSKLASLLTVCKSWGDLIVEILWFRPTLDEKTLERITSVMKKDRNETFWDYRRYIRRLNLSFLYGLIDDDFLSLFVGCINLERLTLVNCSRLSYKPIADILQGCSKLQSIDLTGVYEIRDEILIALAQNCHRLQGLYAPDCPEVSNDAIIQVVKNCPLLKRVKISDNNNINDNGLIAMAEKCKALIEVDVHNCHNLSDYALQKVFTELEQLREFRVSHNQNVTDQIMIDFPETLYLEKLRIIDFTGCLRITDRLVDRLVQAAPRLRNVVLSKCSNISDASLRSLANLGKNLHYVHLGHCTNITDAGVTVLVRNCHRLQYIDLACCIQLTNISVVELAVLPRLKRIGLVKCGLINDAGLLHLIQRRGYDDTLERVHLSYCSNIGFYPIFQLLQACPKLTHLSLTGVQSFLRPDITRFCRQPPSDFNEHQKTLFCVFSGDGVKQLRDYLRKIMSHRENEQANNDLEFQSITPMENIQRINDLFFRPFPIAGNAGGLRPFPAAFPNELTQEDRTDLIQRLIQIPAGFDQPQVQDITEETFNEQQRDATNENNDENILTEENRGRPMSNDEIEDTIMADSTED